MLFRSARAVSRALVVVDLPFPLQHLGVRTAVESCARILKETGCQAVKLEGTAGQADVIAGIAAAGIPVMGHVGLRPQAVHQLGGYRMQRDIDRLMADAEAAAHAGAFAIVLECVPQQVAASITQALSVPSIGIGAGPHCDGQVLVMHDLIGLSSGRVPRFVRGYADAKAVIGPKAAESERVNEELLKTPLLAYVKSAGVYAGATVKAGRIARNDKANFNLYNTRYTMPELLYSDWVQPPQEVQPLMAMVQRLAP